MQHTNKDKMPHEMTDVDHVLYIDWESSGDDRSGFFDVINDPNSKVRVGFISSGVGAMG